MKRNKTLIIGGSGYIGQHLVQEMISLDRDVVVLARSEKESLIRHKNVTYIIGSYYNNELIQKCVDICDQVVHLAYSAMPGVGPNNSVEKLYENIKYDTELFKIIAQTNKKLLLVSSGGTVYGETDTKLINENEKTNPISSYGLIKRIIENCAYISSINEGLKYVCIRPSNAYGGNQKPGTGQGFISTAYDAIKNNKKLTIYGQQGVIRDYIHVFDLSKAIVCSLDKGNISETYNIGTGVGRNNFEIINSIAQYMGKNTQEISIENEIERVFDVKRNVLDISKITKHTGWKPEISIENGINMLVKDCINLK